MRHYFLLPRARFTKLLRDRSWQKPPLVWEITAHGASFSHFHRKSPLTMQVYRTLEEIQIRKTSSSNGRIWLQASFIGKSFPADLQAVHTWAKQAAWAHQCGWKSHPELRLSLTEAMWGDDNWRPISRPLSRKHICNSLTLPNNCFWNHY